MNKETILKVGDWIQTFERVHRIVDETHLTHLINGYIGPSFCLWKPKLGEWCIVDNSENEDIHISFMVHQWEPNSKWTPIPYTGPLPHFIKD